MADVDEDVSVLLKTALDIEEGLRAIKSGCIASAKILRQLDQKLAMIGLQSDRPELLQGGDNDDDLGQVIALAEDITSRVKRAVEINLAIRGREPGNA
jgi:hypothetical protein